MTPQDQIYSLPTTLGLAKLAYAQANNLTVNITHMAIGDGGGAVVNPGAGAVALVREVYRAQLNQLYQHDQNPNWLVAELVLPAEVGGWTIRELALYDAAGDLIYIGNHAEQYKPVQSQGSDETKTIRMVILVSNTSTVTLRTDPTTVMATVDYVQRELAKLDHKQSSRYATKAEIVLSGLAVQAGGDWGAALAAGDRVLVKNQAAAKDNGIYVAAGGAWARSTDADLSAEVTAGLIVTIEQGATLADTRWQLVTDGAIVLGVTALTFQNITQGFAPLTSPAFTDSPTAPTPPQFDRDQSIATMEALQRALGSFRGVTKLTANLALTAAHVGQLVVLSGAGSLTVSLPAANTVPAGVAISFFVDHGASVSDVIARSGADIINVGLGAFVSQLTANNSDFVTLVSDGVSAWYATSRSIGLDRLSSFGSSLAISGYQKLPSGIVIQWGRIEGPLNPPNNRWDLDIIFPIAFSECFSMTAVAGVNAVDLDAPTTGGVYREDKTAWHVGLPTAYAFEAAVHYDTRPWDARTFVWQAIGRL